ncbi:uncharacterized protein LOC123402705 isoform X2 [Hordeum vulgare subsp. vulgare]|uniref:uncharacterized protein LOC123402705 isoform X2 n=1 Tax=Hordeum vulgare subsp. vulgare TaxID=112509 RepID=UPI001D1A4C61|nr:uncharacterized protein LOC123402705 isoform X2 [Hordeum vulgare subsp. vulgare]
MRRKPCIKEENLPSWFIVKEYRRATGRIYKTYYDAYNKQMYRSIGEVAKAFGLGGKNKPCPKPLDIRKEDGSCGSLPMVSYTIIPAIPDYVGKDIASDSINLEQELKKTGDVASTMKGEEEKDNEEIGYAASNLKNEEEMAKKINTPWENAVSMEDEDVAEEVKSRDHA